MAQLSHPQSPPASKRIWILMLFATALLWSTSGFFGKYLPISALAINAGRSWIALPFFAAFLYYNRTPDQPKFKLTWLNLLGGASFIGAQIFFIFGVKVAPVANIIFLAYTSPIYVALLSYPLLGEKPKRIDWVTMLIIFCGMLLFFGSDISFAGVRGNLLGVITGICFAINLVAMRLQKNAVPLENMVIGAAIGAVLGLPWLLQAELTWPIALALVFLGVFQIGLGTLLYSIAIKHVNGLEALLILMLEPIATSLWALIGLGETPGVLSIIGAVLVILATLMRGAFGVQATAA